ILITRFLTDGGVGELVDFMPISGTAATERHRLIRMVRCVRGEMEFELTIAPRFDYGRATHQTHLTANGAVFTSSGTAITVHVVREREDERFARVETGDA